MVRLQIVFLLLPFLSLLASSFMYAFSKIKYVMLVCICINFSIILLITICFFNAFWSWFYFSISSLIILFFTRFVPIFLLLFDYFFNFRWLRVLFFLFYVFLLLDNLDLMHVSWISKITLIWIPIFLFPFKIRYMR